MLKAILEGKAGRVSVDGEEQQSWREVFRKREDLLTAVFFGRIQYLSAAGEQQVLALLVGKETAEVLGPIKEIIYWPRLAGMDSRSYVEPDVLMVFNDSMLLIEVKPPFGGGQYEDQWRNEIESLILQRENNNCDLDIPDNIYFLALGCKMPDWKSVASKLENEFSDDCLKGVAVREWDQISHEIAKMHEENEVSRDKHVLFDWMDAFSLFGIVEKPLPFSDLISMKYRVEDSWRNLFREGKRPIEEPFTQAVEWWPLMNFTAKTQLRIQAWK